MKRLLLLVSLALLASFAFAAVANYTFGYSTGTYTEITGGTPLGTCTVGGSGVTSLDNVTYFNTSLPFLFGFNGRQYSQIAVNSNGYLIFGGSTVFAESNQIAATTVADGIAVAYGKDNQGIVLDGSLGEIRYQTLDSAPSRIFVIQWKNFRDFSASGDLLNFQIRLYETSNVIKFAYGAITVVNTETCQVGLRGLTNADFFDRTTTTSWASSTAGTAYSSTMAVSSTIYPANGSVYTFTPDAVTAIPAVAGVVSPANAATNVFATATLNWSDGGGWTTGFKIYFSPTSSFPPGSPIDLGYVTSYDPPGDMAYTTPYSWKIVPYNGLGENTTGTTWTFTTAGAPLSGTKIIGTTVPYDYLTFTAAINALNASGVGAGGVTFQVQNGTYNESPPAITASGTATDQIKFQAVTGANPVVTPAGGALTFGFKLTDADWVTFDNIDVTGPNTLITGYWLAGVTNGATNNTIKNCTITVPYSATSNYGIYSLGVTGGANSNNTFLSNNVVTPYYGIYLSGSSTTGSEAQSLNVQGNTLTGIRYYGVYAAYAINCTIQYNNIGFYSGGTSYYYGIYTSGSTGTYNVHHNTISGGYTSSYVYAIYQASGTGVYDHNDISSLYNTSSSGWYGIDIYGGSADCTFNTITNITLTGTASLYGYYGYATSTTWSNNSISSVTMTSGTLYAAYMYTGTNTFHDNTISGLSATGTIYGLYMISGTTNTAYSNKIYNLNYSGTSTGTVNGIYISSGTTSNVYNNFVYDLRAAVSTGTAPQIKGISITGGTTSNIWYNSVYLNASGSNTAFSTAALYVSAGTTIDLKNNIFDNESTPGATGRTVAFWKTTAGVANLAVSSDKNIYYAGLPDATHLIGYFNSVAYQTLSDYKTMTATVDQGSYSENVPFLGQSREINLHIDPAVQTRVEGNAIVIGSVLKDIDNDDRASNPDIGADEGPFTPMAGVPGIVTLLTPVNGATLLNPTSITATWTAPAIGGTPTKYYVFVSTSNVDFFDNVAGYAEVNFPATSLDLATISGLTLGYSNSWYWAVQAHNGSGDSNPDDPNFMIWHFTTSGQMTAPATLAIGNAWPSSDKTGTIAVTNIGSTSLTFTADGSPEFHFGTLRYTIPANTTSNLAYTFTAPATTGAYSGSITLQETSPGTSSVSISVTANITTDVIVGNGTTNLSLPVYPFYKTSYSQTIYYPSELNYPAGYRIEKLYYYYNGVATCLYTKDFVIYMGHTTESTFATTTSWLPISGFTQVYNHENIPQAATGGYWMEFVLDTPFVYDGVRNLAIAVEENVITSTYDPIANFFYSTDTAGVNRSILQYSDTVDADPAAPPTASGLKAGFPNTKFFVAPLPVNPLITVNPASWNYGTVTINTTNDKQITITNTGGGTLTITSITYAGNTYYQLQNLPGFSVNLASGQSTNFIVRYLPLASGTHTGIVTIHTNIGNTDVNLTGSCVDPRITSLPHTQNFDGVTAPAFPLGWTGYKSYTSSTLNTSTTYAQSTPNSVYMYNSTTTEIMRLISPQVTVPMNSFKLSFYARGGSAGYIIKVGTVSALDGTGVFTELGSFTLTAAFAQYNLSFATAGTDPYICFQHAATSTYQSIYIDNVQLEQLMANDLAATAITGPAYGLVGTQLSYNVTVYNNGTAPQAVYTVHLKRYGDDRLASLPINNPANPLLPGASIVHTINWTPLTANAGNYSVVGEIELTGDGNASNNESAAKAIGIYPANAYTPLIGDPLGTTTINTLPVDVYYKNSLSETIYTAREMQMTSGTIQGVVFFNNFTQTLLAKPVKIWAKNTTSTDLSAGYLAFTGYTLVFDGTVDFPIGVNSIYIPFNITTISYTGGNFALRVNRPMDTAYFAITNTFYYTLPKYDNNRSYELHSDSDILDPTSPTQGSSTYGGLTSNIPVTAFMVTDAVPVVLAEPAATITKTGTDIVLNWAAVPGAYAYRVYGSNDPYEWPGTLLSVVWTNTYTWGITLPMEYFHVIAVSSYRDQETGLITNPVDVIGSDNSKVRIEPALGNTNNKD